jgi:iron complex transport system substrate-binding protein
MVRHLTPLILAIALLAGACGAGSEPSEPETASPSPETTEAAAFPLTLATAAGSVTIEAPPERIVSLSPSSTESLFAMGAGPQVVAVDDQSNYPSEAPTTDLSGFGTSAEGIASYDPDLVVLSFDPGDLLEGLEALGIPAILHPAAATVADAFEQIEQLGSATGHAEEAAALVASMQSELDEIVGALPPLPESIVYYHELDPTRFSVTSTTFVGELYGLLGAVSVADPADPDGFGYPQLSSEFILDEDPDVIFLADTKCCGETPETLGARPGWDSLTAVQSGRVYPLDDDIASRWGPRIVLLVESAAAAVADLAEAAP